MSLEDEINFSFKLLTLLYDSTKKSTIFSPTSILIGLAMIFPGAKDKTLKQTQELIGKDKNDEEILDYYSMFLKHQNNKNDSRIKVTVTNQLFVSQKLNLLPKFDEIMENYFDGKVQKMNFKKSNETSTKINEIFNQKTNGQIKNITKPFDIKPELAVLLINALQFSAKWKNIFRTPKKQTFYSYDCSREIDMFHRQVMEKCQWNYIQNDESCVLGIPYVNNSAWMYIVLPNEKNGLQKIVENLKPENFYQWTKRSPNLYVIVRIPVMNISNEFQLKESLQKLGMKDAFEDDICNLTKMIKEPSKLDKIIHKTVMKTDEYGTEASAATSIYDLRCGGRNERFKADHPFLFFITTNKPKDFKPINILFIGTFC